MRHQAIRNLYPNVVTIDDSAGAFDAQGNLIAINEQALQAEITRLQADYVSKQYQRDRAAEYPAIADQLDLLYHGGMDAWKTAILEVKNKYPKPE
jgi:hypothetical protein